MKDYAERHGGIDGLRYFGHSGPNALYFSDSNGYGSLYSNGPGFWHSYLPFNNAQNLYDIDPSWFKPGAPVQLFGCKSANGENSFAENFANRTNTVVTGSQDSTYFSGVKNGKPNQGLPNKTPSNYSGSVYLGPPTHGNGWTTFGNQ